MKSSFLFRGVSAAIAATLLLMAPGALHGQSTPALTKRLRAFSQKPVDVPTLCMGVSGA